LEKAAAPGIEVPQPLMILHWNKRGIVASCDLAATSDWAKPILLAALTSSN
jgi:hypothetical protein